jgi:hypothetical protein
MKFPVFSLLTGNFSSRDGFARDCPLQRRVTSQPPFACQSPECYHALAPSGHLGVPNRCGEAIHDTIEDWCGRARAPDRDQIAEVINGLGGQGWELVTTCQKADSTLFFVFKRLKD